MKHRVPHVAAVNEVMQQPRSRGCRFSKPALMLICSIVIVLFDIVFLHGEIFSSSATRSSTTSSLIDKTIQALSVPSHSKKSPGIRSSRSKDDPFWQQYHNMSIVYTWVNGSDPVFAAKRAAHGKRGSESRYRDTEELLHSLRSFALYAPWHTGMIFIVTPGDHPYWLDISHPRIKIIDQETLIPSEVLPVFNSAIIEMNLYKIEGLSDIFIHMNDDYLIGRPLHPSDFVTDDGGVRLYHEKGTISGGLKEYRRNKAARVKLWLSSVYHTAGLLSEEFGRGTRRFVKHAPFVYSKEIMVKMRSRWQKHFKVSQHEKFRSHGDILIPFAHHGFVKATRMISFSDHVGDNDQDAILCIVKDDMSTPHSKMVDHISHPHLYFTVNDGFKLSASAEWLRSFLHHILPEPSEFELLDRSPLANRTDIAAWSDDYDVMSVRSQRASAGTLGSEDRSGGTKQSVLKKPKAAAASCDYSCSGHGECTSSGCRCASGFIGMFCDYEDNGQKTYEIVPDCEGVDVVFTWVNGSDPTLINNMRTYSNVTDTNRIRDFGQLRYGLRSILVHAPWVRHIWVVSGTMKPDWLSSSDPRLSFVSHDEIFTEDELPQLNSNSIQLRLWKIKHLAHRFISMDDDFFLNLPVPPEMVLGSSLTQTTQFYRSRFRPSRLIDGVYKESLIGTKKQVKNIFEINGFDREWYSVGHVPPVFDKYMTEEVQHEFQDNFNELVKKKIRSPEDFEPTYAYAFMIQGLAKNARETLKVFSEKQYPAHDLVCKIAGRHHTRWSETQKASFSEKYSTDCIEDIISSSPTAPLPESCQSLIHKEVTKLSTTFNRDSNAGGYFVMMTNKLSFKTLTKNLKSGTRRFVCLNDDYGVKVCS